MNNWRPVLPQDLPAVVALARQHFESEVDHIFRTDPIVYEHNLALAVVNQLYNPHSVLLLGCWSGPKLLGYTWVARGERAVWSGEEMAAVRMAHLDLTIPARERIHMIRQMISFWSVWATEAGLPIICSTTLRSDQQGFLRIHQQAGYTVRGSIAYLRLAT